MDEGEIRYKEEFERAYLKKYKEVLTAMIKANKILDILEEKGIISKVDPITKRRILL